MTPTQFVRLCREAERRRKRGHAQYSIGKYRGWWNASHGNICFLYVDGSEVSAELVLGEPRWISPPTKVQAMKIMLQS